VTHIPSGKCRPPRRYDARDLDVAELDWSPYRLPPGGHRCRLMRSVAIEIDDVFLKISFQRTNKGDFKLVFAAPSRQKLDAKADLKDRDSCGPDRFRGLPIHPFAEREVGHGFHQARHHIGVEDYHFSKIAGRAG